MDKLIEINRSLEAAGALADALEEQVGPAFMPRMQLVRWVLEQFDDPASLKKAAENVRQLHPQLLLDYECFQAT